MSFIFEVQLLLTKTAVAITSSYCKSFLSISKTYFLFSCKCWEGGGSVEYLVKCNVQNPLAEQG